MLGVAPLLLIDAQNFATTAKDIGDNSHPRCYFIPDMHGMIPFVLEPDDTDRDYVAPAYFDALLSHEGGSVDPGTGNWADTDADSVPDALPHTWYVWMHDKSVRYTLKPVYDDVGKTAARFSCDLTESLGSYDSLNVHPYDESLPPDDKYPERGAVNWELYDDDWESPNGYGTPYYAVVQYIDDRHGNRIEFEYAPFERIIADDPCTTDWTELVQLGQQKGQIRRILLRSGVDPSDPVSTPGTVEWTIVPIYRTFGGNTGEAVSDENYPDIETGIVYQHREADYAYNQAKSAIAISQFGDHRYESQRAVQSVYVYDYDYDPYAQNPGVSSFTISHSAFLSDIYPQGWTGDTHGSREATLDALWAIDGESWASQASLALNDDWRVRAKYLYADGGPLFYRPELALLDNPQYETEVNGYHRPLLAPRLLVASVTKKPESQDRGQSLHALSQHWLYRYRRRANFDAGYRQYTIQQTHPELPSSHLNTSDPWELESIWNPDELDALRHNISAANPLATHWPVRLALVGDEEDIGTPPDATPAGAQYTAAYGGISGGLLAHATQRFHRWDSPGAGRLHDASGGTGSQMAMLGTPFYAELREEYVYPWLHVVPTDQGENQAPLAILHNVALHIDRTDNTPVARRMYRFLAFREGWFDGGPGDNDDPLEGGSIFPWSGDGFYGGLAQAWHYHAGGTFNHNSYYVGRIPLARSLYFYPFALHAGKFTGGDEGTIFETPFQEIYAEDLDRAFWVTVVDEYRDPGAAVRDDGFSASNWPDLDSEVDARLPDTRRVVVMNRTGHILKERIYDIKEGGQVAFESGTLEERIYDWSIEREYGATPPEPYDKYDEPKGRLIEIRSKGWSVANQAGNGDEDGLITVFDYDTSDDVAGSLKGSMEVAAVGLKRGTGDASHEIYWQRQFVRDSARPDLVRYEVEYASPVTDLAFDYNEDISNADFTNTLDDVYITYYGNVLEQAPSPVNCTPGDEIHRAERRLVERVEIRPPGRVYRISTGAVDHMFPVEATRYHYHAGFTDEWMAMGLVRLDSASNPFGIGNPTEVNGQIAPQTPPDYGKNGSVDAEYFYINLMRTDGEGRLVFDITDLESLNFLASLRTSIIQETGIVGGSGEAILPDGWGRAVPDVAVLPPLNQWTYLAYSDFGLTRRERFDGTGEMRTYALEALGFQDVLVTRVYQGLVIDTPSGDVTGIGEPGEITRALAATDEIYQVDQVEWLDSIPTDGPTGAETFDVIACADIEMSGGRLSKLDIEGSDNEEGESNSKLTLEMDAGGFGQIHREKRPSGSITRRVYSRKGYLTHVFKGTNDEHPYWGTAVSPDPDENMALVEKRYYGVDIDDADELIAIRRFTESVTNQYPVYDGSGEIISPSNEDTIGWIETVDHDWRMRPVRRSLYSGPSPSSQDAVRHTVTYIDHLDREVMTATYAGEPPALTGIDPRSLGPTDPIPTAIAVLSQTPRPLALTETVYNDRSLVEEVRTYDVTAPTPGDYIATVTSYDHEDRGFRVQSPNRGLDETLYDALGRLAATRRWITEPNDVQLSATQSLYIADLEVTASDISLERRHDATTELQSLDESNGVKSQTLFWYDDNNRVIARAELGTNSIDVTDSDHRATSHYVNGSYIDVTSHSPSYPELPPERGALPAAWVDAMYWEYEYDERGQLIREVDPLGVATEYVYDDLGRELLVTKNADGASDPTDVVQTAYRYRDDQVIGVAEIQHDAMFPAQPGTIDYEGIDWESPATGIVLTTVDFGADVVDPATGAAITRDNDMIVAVRFPGANALETSPAYTFSYDLRGMLHERTDARAITMTHSYDVRGLLTATEIDDDAWFPYAGGDPGDPTPPGGDPDSAHLARVEYEYDALGRLLDARSYTGPLLDRHLVAANRFAYGAYGNLSTAWQEIENPVSAMSSPRVSYAWETSSADGAGDPGVNRIKSIDYPRRLQGAEVYGRTVEYSYGSWGFVDAVRSNELGAPNNTVLLQSLEDIAAFSRTGVGRTIAQELGSELRILHFDPDTGDYSGYDRFGRLAETLVERYDGVAMEWQELQRYRYGYDGRGMLSYAKYDKASTEPERSERYAYDAPGRLRQSRTGAFTFDMATGDAAINTGAINWGSDWGIDRQGNRIDNGVTLGRESHEDNNGDGVFDLTVSRVEGVNLGNELHTVTETYGGGTPSDYDYVYDPSGNLVSNGVYYYMYDAWSRLFRVHELGTLTFDTDGAIASGEPGEALLSYTYDALGRPIRRYGKSSTAEWNERYFYDGDRRIQEDVEYLDDPLILPYTRQQYVWSPDGLDSLLAFYSARRVRSDRQYLFYPFLDADGTVLAYADRDGDIAREWSFDAYGNVVDDDTVSIPPDVPFVLAPRAGHQGLMADAIELADDHADPRAAANGTTIYLNRNRVYDPRLERFLQRDPNGMGQATLLQAAYGGAAPTAPAPGAPDLQAHYGDGTNAFAYLGADPVNNSDALGLFLGLFGPTTGLDLYLDYNEEVIDTGLSMRDMFQIAFDDYSYGQLYAAEVASDTTGRLDGDVFGYSAGGAILVAPGRTHNHHLIPRFMMGIDAKINRYRLPQSEHELFHRILREEFAIAGLPHENSRGDMRWRTRLKNRAAGAKEAESALDALFNAARRFDIETSGRHSLESRVAESLAAGGSGASAFRRLIRSRR